MRAITRWSAAYFGNVAREVGAKPGSGVVVALPGEPVVRPGEADALNSGSTTSGFAA